MSRLMSMLVLALLLLAAVGHLTSKDNGQATAPSLFVPAKHNAVQTVTVGRTATSALPVALPIPNPGWVRRIATPAWPGDLAAHMSPSGVTNQCVAGALATWALAHAGDPRWNRPPALAGNAIDIYGIARSEGFVLSSQPAPGAMVVYGSSYGMFGHIATVVAVQAGRYEVVEQNFLDFNPNLERHWQTFDLRSIAWPDPAVRGFVVSPR